MSASSSTISKRIGGTCESQVDCIVALYRELPRSAAQGPAPDPTLAPRDRWPTTVWGARRSSPGVRTQGSDRTPARAHAVAASARAGGIGPGLTCITEYTPPAL